MTPIEKAKEALKMISDSGTGKTIPARSMATGELYPSVVTKTKWARIADKALAALEADKPVEDDLCDIIERLSVCQSRWSDDWKEKTAYSIKKYAESYHAKKCAECTRKKADYKLFGVD